MEKNSRRDFLKMSAVAGTALASAPLHPAKAGPKNILSPDRMGVLVDTTVCVGCRSCEWACKVAHKRPTPPLTHYEDQSVFKDQRRPDHESVTVVNKYDEAAKDGGPVYVKVQCMHCDRPSCVSACIVGAFTKEENGSVIWDTKKCIGCRYCMVACPFQVPAFEFGEALKPDVVKCDFCFSRTKEGKLPACVETCPVEALTYGPRTDLIKVARERIRRYPERYVNHIYGENEAGGTSWMYLASKDFASLGLPNVGMHAMPGTSESIQHGIFAYFIPPVLLYALLGGVMWVTRRRKESEHEELT